MSIKKVIKLFHNILWLIPFFCFTSGYVFVHFYLQAKTESTPVVIGKSLHEAAMLLSQKRLGLLLLKEQEDLFLPEGTIIYQVPAPYQTVRPNQCVFVTVSKKPKPKLSPDLLGKFKKEIESDLSNLSVKLRIITLKNKYSQGRCIAQYPQPGREIVDHKVITYLSSGKDALYVVPNFQGLSIGLVEEYLIRMGVRLEIFDLVPNYNLHEPSQRKVVDQKPIAGTIVNLSKKLYMQLQVDADINVE